MLRADKTRCKIYLVISRVWHTADGTTTLQLLRQPMIYLLENQVNLRIIEQYVNLSIKVVGEGILEEEVKYIVSFFQT